MRQILLAAILFIPGLFAQDFRGNTTVNGTLDASSATSTKPFAIGTSLPALCSQGQTYFLLNVTAGQNFYGCTATNTWTLQSGGSGGGTSFTFPASGSIVSSTGNGFGAATVTNLSNLFSGCSPSNPFYRYDGTCGNGGTVSGFDFSQPYSVSRIHNYANTGGSHGEVRMVNELFANDNLYLYPMFGGNLTAEQKDFYFWKGENLQDHMAGIPDSVGNQPQDPVPGSKTTWSAFNFRYFGNGTGQNAMYTSEVNHHGTGDFQINAMNINQHSRSDQGGDEGLVWNRVTFRDGTGQPIQTHLSGVIRSSCAADHTTGGLVDLYIPTIDNVLKNGSGFTGTATLTITGGGGTGATGTVTVTSDGHLSNPVLTAQGTGYTGMPTVTINGNGSGAVINVHMVGSQPNGDASAPNGAKLIPVTVDNVSGCAGGDFIAFGKLNATSVPASNYVDDTIKSPIETVQIDHVDIPNKVIWVPLRSYYIAPGTKIAPSVVLVGQFGPEWAARKWVIDVDKAVSGGVASIDNTSPFRIMHLNTGASGSSGVSYTWGMAGGTSTASGSTGASAGCAGIDQFGNKDGNRGWVPIETVDSTTQMKLGTEVIRQDGRPITDANITVAPCAVIDTQVINYNANPPYATQLVLQPNQFNWGQNDMVEIENPAFSAGFDDTNVAIEHILMNVAMPGKRVYGRVYKDEDGTASPLYGAIGVLRGSGADNWKLMYRNPLQIEGMIGGQFLKLGSRIKNVGNVDAQPLAFDMTAYPALPGVWHKDPASGKYISEDLPQDGKFTQVSLSTLPFGTDVDRGAWDSTKYYPQFSKVSYTDNNVTKYAYCQATNAYTDTHGNAGIGCSANDPVTNLTDWYHMLYDAGTWATNTAYAYRDAVYYAAANNSKFYCNNTAGCAANDVPTDTANWVINVEGNRALWGLDPKWGDYVISTYANDAGRDVPPYARLRNDTLSWDAWGSVAAVWTRDAMARATGLPGTNTARLEMVVSHGYNRYLTDSPSSPDQATIRLLDGSGADRPSVVLDAPGGFIFKPTASDPKCDASNIGKPWFNTADANNTVVRFCVMTAGLPGWKTAVLQ